MASKLTDLTVEGYLRADEIILSANSVKDEHVSEAFPLGATKTHHQRVFPWAQKHGAIAATERIFLFTARNTGIITSFVAGMVAANVGAATVTFDLKKNGTTILNAVITLDSGDANYDVLEATFSGSGGSDAEYVLDDVFEVVITATAGGGTLGQGPFCQANVNEAPEI